MRGPWHLWAIGIVALLWNAGGAYDYVMTQSGNTAYLSLLTEPQRAHLDARPTWFDATWAIGVWMSVAGSILLLVRSRFAATAFGLSIFGLIASSVWSYGLASPPASEVMGTVGAIFSIAICVVLLALYIYARRMQVAGYLR